ncbi:MAG: MBL fold metallo-hydrolase [Gemmataceae bacterium]|nr:MBL fold metallo-hydrolase [Gemmataceae bacterium]
MQRLFLLSVLFVFPWTSAAQDDKDKPLPPVQVTWHGQSFFTVKSGQGTVVAFDPHLIEQYGRPQGIRADIILTSHNHNDHTQVSAIDNFRDKNVRVIAGLKGAGFKATWSNVNEKIKDVAIRNVGSYHDDTEGMQRGRNSIFIVEIDGWRIVHLGDLGHQLSADQVKRIGPVDVLMVPVGGIYTLNGSEAKKVAAALQPKEYIFPMHYGTKVFDDLLPINEFLEDQDRARIAASNDNKVLLNRDPTRPRPLIVQLHYWPKGKRDE